MSVNDVKLVEEAAARLRLLSIEATHASNSGHPTSCASMADVLACLFLKVMRYHVQDPRNPNNDRFVLSKGHAAPILYAAWAEVGLLKEKDVLQLRKLNSDLEGHPTPRLSFIDVATGSLGQGINYATGMAYVEKYFDHGLGGDYRVYTLLGDGECAEGSVWEALAFASYYQLDNFVVIVDVNRLGQSQPTSLQHDLDTYRKRFEAFGMHTIVVDGHNVEELLAAFSKAEEVKKQPTCILAKTLKGKGIVNVADKENFHGKPMTGDLYESALKALKPLTGGDNPTKIKPQEPKSNQLKKRELELISLSKRPSYEIGQKVGPRAAYGTALLKLAENCPYVLGLDADTKNSTMAITLHNAIPKQFCECFIAEQNMVGVGIGAACRNRTVPFVSTFAAFFTRAFDHIRMGAISQSSCNFVGSHIGCHIGEDGPSQMGLEDMAMFRTIPDAVVFYPSDAVAMENAVELAARTPSICFIRSGRGADPVIYQNSESFEIGKAKVVHRSGAMDQVTIVAAGVTLHEAFRAAAELTKENINVRIIDPFTIKPMDRETILTAARSTQGRILTVEDHYYEGGLGEAVQSAVAGEPGFVVHRLAVTGPTRSGPSAELLKMYNIDHVAIVKAVKEF